jgi:hypothetical protein
MLLYAGIVKFVRFWVTKCALIRASCCIRHSDHRPGIEDQMPAQEYARQNPKFAPEPNKEAPMSQESTIAAADSLLHPMAASEPKRDRIRLSLNENPFGPSPRALQAIKAHLEGLVRRRMI